MEVKLENVSYYDHEIMRGDWLNSPHKVNKHIENCSLVISSGSLVGLIGSSQETIYLLKLISLRHSTGQIIGHIQHDNSIRKIGLSCYRDIAFISAISSSQHCLYFQYLSINKYLFYSIELRLPYLTTSECHNRVHEICRLLDLNASLFIHELEDGQLFLLSLATELVTNPPLICIESPIDTLDEYSSVLIVQTLAKIAHRFNTSTTIIFTAQSPSSTIFSSLDQVVVFFDKKILYSSKTFFEKDHLGRAQQVLSSALQTPPRGTTGVPGAGLLAPHPTFEYCYQTLELISREIKRCGYGTKLFYLTPDLLRIVAKDVDLLHFLVADPQQSNLLLERYVDRFHGREMREKKQKLEAILQRYVQFIVLKTIEFQSEQRKTDRVISGEQGEDADAPLKDRFLLDFSRTSEASVLDAEEKAPRTPTKPLKTPAATHPSTPSRQRRLPPAMVVKSSNPFLTEVSILFQRAWASATTNHTSVTIAICQYLLSGILLGLFAFKAGEKSTYTNDDTTTANDDTWINDDSFSITSTLFFLLLIQIYIHIYSIPYHLSHISLLKTEISSSVYHPLSAYLTLQFFHWSVHLIGSAIITTLIYTMLHLTFSSSLHLFYFYLVILLYIYTSLSLLTVLCLYLPSTTHHTQSSSNTVTYTYLLFSSVILLLSGYLQPLSNLSYPLHVLSHLSYGRYAFQTLMILCYGDTISGRWYLERYSFNNTSDDTIEDCIFSLFLWFAALQLCILWGLYPFQSRVLYSQALGYFGRDGLPRRAGGPGASSVGSGTSAGDGDLESNSRTANRLLQNDHSLSNDQHLIDSTYHTPTPASPSALAINQPSYPSGFQPVLHSVTIVPLDPSKRTSLQFRNINFYLKTSTSSASSSFYFSSSPSSATSQSLSLLKQYLPSLPRFAPPPPPADVSSDPNYELLLRNLSGECNPNQLWCILDSEDDTTSLTVLLHLLSGISKPYGITTGQFTINGIVEMLQGAQQPFENLVYVCKGDSPNHRYLTVREVLYYQILLRRRTQKSCEGFIRWAEMCWGATPQQRQRKMEEVRAEDDPYLLEELSIHEQLTSLLQLFQLDEIGDLPLLIGDSTNPHISPSQLRCLTIAMEAVHSPGIYLLQDPLEGLDWYHTERVLRVLRGLVDGGRCVVCAISNPTERMLCYFNRLMLLHKGLLLYSGEMNSVKEHFDRIGYQALPQQSLLDYLYDVCHGRAMLTSLAASGSASASQQPGLSPEVGRKRAPSSLLTPEDLANIRHSMDGYSGGLSSRNTVSSRRSHSSSISAGHSGNGSASAVAAAAAGGGGGDEIGERLTSFSTDLSPFQFVIEDSGEGGGEELEDIPMPFGPVVTRSVPLVLPSARVTLYRRCISAFRNRRMIVLYWVRSFLVSVVLGLVWYDTDSTDVQAKLMLASTAYLYIVGCLADLFEGTHRRQTDYLRERVSVAQTAQAYWWSDGTPVLIHSMMNALLLTTPLYFLAGYRTGSGHFVCYAFLLYLSVYCNVGLMYLVSALTKRASMSRIIYLGLLLPLQLLFCGSLIYLSTYPSWLRWGAYLNPMHFYLAAFFINEFHENSETFPSSSTHHYDDLKSQYGYRTSLLQSIFLLMLLGYVYKLLWLLSLKYRELWTLSSLPFKKVYRAAKKKMRKIMRAGLRFSKRRHRSAAGGSRGGEGRRGGGKRMRGRGGEDGSYVLDGLELDQSTESYEEWRSEDDEDSGYSSREEESSQGTQRSQSQGQQQQSQQLGMSGGGGGAGNLSSEGQRAQQGKGGKKKRKSLGEEMLVRGDEEGMLLFGMLNHQQHQPQQQQQQQRETETQQSHHSILSALYRPEYLQSSSPSATGSSPNASGASPNASGSGVGGRLSKNRIVVSKSQRASASGAGVGAGQGQGGGQGQDSSGGSESLHSSLRI